MMYHSRANGIEHISARKNHVCYGMGIGISASPFPIQYEICEGVDSTQMHESSLNPRRFKRTQTRVLTVRKDRCSLTVTKSC
jgi:hypothetical protein